MASVAFRVDASPAIGIGHVMRCVTLADVLARRGARVLMISRHLPPHLQALVARRGLAWVQLTHPADEPDVSNAVPHAAWLGTSQAADAAETCRVLEGGRWQWMVVDHYALDHRWASDVRHSADRICVIDDVADRRHDCDVLMDQNLYPDMDVRYNGKTPDGCTRLLGPQYALIMVLLGGMDVHNHTAKVVRALGRVAGHVFDVDVVIGRQHPAPAEVASLCAVLGYRCHVQLEDVASMMQETDLAIGASGSTSWERCALGVPTVCLTHADNQVAIARGLATAGAVLNLGDGTERSEAEITAAIGALLDDPGQVRAMSQAAWGITDGRGADRVADVLERETIR
jgi:UDP-2,4-diacetamido-2,4,6-trideoxy-beta-L-altropyranose hydrolase